MDLRFLLMQNRAPYTAKGHWEAGNDMPCLYAAFVLVAGLALSSPGLTQDIEVDSLLQGMEAECQSYSTSVSREAEARFVRELEEVGKTASGPLNLEGAINAGCMAFQLEELLSAIEDIQPGVIETERRSRFEFQIQNLRPLYFGDISSMSTTEFLDAVRAWQRGDMFLWLQDLEGKMKDKYPQNLGGMRLNGFTPFHGNEEVGLIFQYEITRSLTQSQKDAIVAALKKKTTNGDCTNINTPFYELFSSGVVFIHQLVVGNESIFSHVTRYSECP